MPTVYVYSVDFDGCLVGTFDQDPKIHNLIRHIVSSLENDANSHAVLMVGSYRQSISADSYCISVNKNGSCFPVYQQLLAAFQISYPEHAHRVSFDPLLLADIHESKEAGTHFDKAIQLHKKSIMQYFMSDQTPEQRWHDVTKCGLQYVQMHHIALRFPNDIIHYYLHDNCDDAILTPSHFYFARFRLLVPKNVVHNHHHYVLGRYVKKYAAIKGQGHIDLFYRDNIRHFDGNLKEAFIRNATLTGIVSVSLDEEMDNLRREFLLETYRYRLFKDLIQRRGLHFVNYFVITAQSNLLRDDYHGFLLHGALAENNSEKVIALLQQGANYLLSNEQGVDALSLAVEKKSRDFTLCVTEYANIRATNKQLVQFVSTLSADDFYQWISQLLNQHFYRSANVLLQHRLGNMSPDHADFAKYFIEKYHENQTGQLHCTKTLIWELLQMLKKVEQFVSIISQELRLFRSHTAILPGDGFENTALDALCYFISEFYELNHEPFSVQHSPFYEILFETIKMTPEISERMTLSNHSTDERIMMYYRWFIGYQAVMYGRAKEELNDLNRVANDICKRFVRREASLLYIAGYLKAQCQNIPWGEMMRGTVDATPKQVILKSIKIQALKNENNRLIQVLFVSLQSLVSQVESLPSVVGLIKQWLDKQASDASRVTVREVMQEGDDEGCFCFSFFSPQNMRFLEKLPAKIEAVSRYS